MKDSQSAANITHDDLQTNVLSYQDYLPPKIQGLEDLRLQEIPETLAKRKQDGDAFLEKTEVTSLVEWKLKYGTYRPNLLKLVASNSIDDVRDTSKSAFAIYDADNDDYAKAITTFNKLKGIGPATASLMLSCYDPEKVPFFSDELYRYLHWEEAKSKGWDRKIGYTTKEYKSLFEKTKALRERLNSESKKKVTAIDIEKAAYALGNSAKRTCTFIKDDDEKENDDALQPPSPKRRKKAPPPPISLGIQRVEECRQKGLRGSPTYDELGFELDKEYIIKHTGGRPRPLGKRAMDRMAKQDEERERKGEIMGVTEDSKNSIQDENVWDDLVARNLGLAYHEVGIEDFEQWHEKGFKTRPEKFKDLSSEEKDRIQKLTSGCALRKGSKHR